MSVVTNVILCLGLSDEGKLERVNEFFSKEYQAAHPSTLSCSGQQGFVDCCDPSLPEGWYGGTKGLEACICIGAFNYFPLEVFLLYLQKNIDWEDPENIQVMVQRQDDNRFVLINVMEWKPPDWLTPNLDDRIERIN